MDERIGTYVEFFSGSASRMRKADRAVADPEISAYHVREGVCPEVLWTGVANGGRARKEPRGERDMFAQLGRWPGMSFIN